MAGFGLLPVGLGPFGLGTPVSADPIPSGGAGSRFIDPKTGDYAQDVVTRQFQQMPPLRQRVLLALLTVFSSSSALPKFGIQLPRKMGTTYEAQVRNAVNASLNVLVNVEKIMRVDGIDVIKGTSGRSLITVSYTDLTTNTRDTVSNGKANG